MITRTTFVDVVIVVGFDAAAVSRHRKSIWK